MPSLPAEFADLQPYADWSLATERERYAKRLASTSLRSPLIEPASVTLEARRA